MSIEGEITVDLSTTSGRVDRVEIRSSRRVDAPTRLSGRSIDEVVRRVPLMFPVCGVAHVVACSRAIEAAIGVATSARVERARELACLAEAANSLIWQLAITWREAAGEHPQIDLVRAARRAGERLRAAVFETRSVSEPRASIDVNKAHAAAIELAAAMTRLLSEPCPLAERVFEDGRASLGHESSAVRRQATFDLAIVARRLATDAGFSALPELEEPIDTSSLARHCDEIDVEEVISQFGVGLLARLLARRAEARCVIDRLCETLDDLLDDSSAPAPRASALSVRPGEGVGLSETARGPLIYRVLADASWVDDVRVVAPTDWLFHPRGVLTRAFEGGEVTAAIARDVGWFIVALDPCVPWTVEVRDA